MRISEMYLTAAEAFARSNQDAKAKEYLQALLKERDPEYKDLGNTGAKLADEIMTHRRIELWGEGFRWFDLKRLGLPLDRTGSNLTLLSVASCTRIRMLMAGSSRFQKGNRFQRLDRKELLTLFYVNLH